MVFDLPDLNFELRSMQQEAGASLWGSPSLKHKKMFFRDDLILCDILSCLLEKNKIKNRLPFAK